MTNRIKISDLEFLVNQINETTDSPKTSYSKTNEGKFVSNIGNYHLYQAYGSIGLHRISNSAGGVNTIFNLGTKKDLYIQLRAFLNGLDNK